MAPQPLTQTTASGPSTATTNSPNFFKDEKCKTAKCKLCGDKIAKYSMKCGRCTKRICSNCIDDDGDSTVEHKAIATDHLENGCWCGFPGGLNLAFKDRLPPPKKAEPIVKKQPVERKLSVSTRATRSKSVAEETRQQSSGSDEIAVQAPLAERKTSVSTRATRSKSKDLATIDDAHVSRQTKAANLDTISKLPSTDTSVPEKKGPKLQRTEDPGPEGLEAPRKKHKAQAIPAGTKPPTDTTQPKRGTKRTRRNDAEGLEAPTKKQKVLPTLSEAGPSRPKRKRNNPTEDPEDETTNLPAKKQKATRGRPAATEMPLPSKDTTKKTIIVGAGVTGLFTAYYLAQKNIPDHEITVVDINDEEFALASGHSAGFVTNHGVPEESEDLLGESYMAWVDLMETKEFQKEVWYSQDNIIPASTLDDNNEEQSNPVAVPWLNSPDLIEDATTLLRLHPPQLGAWLRSECENMDVKFKFGCHPAALENRHAIKSLKLNHTMGGTHELLQYDNLIFAAGAWTGEIVSRLLGEKVDDRVKSYHYATFSSPAPVEKNVGVILPDSSASLTSDRKTGTLRLTSLHPCPRKLLLRDAVDRPRPAALSGLAEKYFSGEMKAREGGQMYVSGGEAVVERLQVGVWAAYGGGEFGLSLAPGMARRVVRGVLDE